ncbi:MAG: DUF2628 domain-containing protein [Eubacterium sp.]|nr:DUF2628 domain-containing protein [Eubacterium sp.]
MIINSNEKCPVCDRNFTDEDDIVICPHCATPHHRECYKALGHCFNRDKHSEGFDYTAEKTDEADSTVNENTQYYQPPVKESSKTVCSQCGAEISNGAPFCSQCGARQSNAQYKEYSPLNEFGFNNTTQQRYENDTQTIDGKSIADVAAVVRTNTEKFIPKFLENKKVSWNWSAFIFGPYYLLYRKMYKQGIVFLALSLITSFVVSGLFAEEIAAFGSFFSSNYQALYSNPSNELITQFMEIYKQVLPMMLITISVNLILRLIIALFADSFYRAKTLEVLDKVDRNLAEGGSFSSSLPMMERSSLSQADMKRLYLGKLGGTSIFTPIIAYLALDLITSFISHL